MSKIILSLIGQNLKKFNLNSAQKSLPNVLFRLSTYQGNYFGNSSLHIYSQQQYIMNNKNDNFISYLNSRKNTLYSDASLGIYKLDSLKESRERLYESGKERYIERLSNYVESNEFKSIFKDDLVNLIAFAENDHHLDLIEKIAVNSKQDQDITIGSWGSAVMRLYYKMNHIDRALKNLKDVEKFGDFFNQRTSYQIVMTMLYNAGRYQELIDVYHFSLERLPKGDGERRYLSDRRLSILLFAAYAKLNTMEALEAAQKLYAQDQNNLFLKMRTVIFLAYLAVNQNKPALALNLLSDAPHRNYVSAREIKTISLIRLKRYEDVLFHIRESITETRRDYKIMLSEVSELLESKMDEIEDEEVKKELNKILVEIKENKLIGDETVESIVFREINRDERERINFDFQQGDRNGGNAMRSYSGYNRPRFNDRASNYNRFPRDNRPSRFRGGGRSEDRYFDRQENENLDDGNRGPGRKFDNNVRQYNRFNSGYNRRQTKSYFEDDLDEDDVDQVNIDKRFR